MPSARSRARSSPSNCTPCTTSDRDVEEAEVREVLDRRHAGSLPVVGPRRRAPRASLAHGPVPWRKQLDFLRRLAEVHGRHGVAGAHRGRRGSPGTAPARPNTARAAPGSTRTSAVVDARGIRAARAPRATRAFGSASIEAEQLVEHVRRHRRLAQQRHGHQRVADVADQPGAASRAPARSPAAPRRGSRGSAGSRILRRSAISARTQSMKRRARRNAPVQIRQLEMRVGVDQRRQDGDAAEVDDVRGRRAGHAPRRRPRRCDRRRSSTAAVARSACIRDRQRPSRAGEAAVTATARGAAVLPCAASRRVVLQLLGHRGVAVGARGRQREHARHVALAEDRIAEDLVVHVAALRDEAGVLDVGDDLDLVHAVAGAGGADDVLLDHHAAHVVGAEGQAELPDLAALRDPRRLQVVEVVEHDARRARACAGSRRRSPRSRRARCARADSSR